MICTECDKSMRFRGVGYRGERRGKEFWRCRCGNEESVELWAEIKETRTGKSREESE